MGVSLKKSLRLPFLSVSRAAIFAEAKHTNPVAPPGKITARPSAFLIQLLFNRELRILIEKRLKLAPVRYCRRRFECHAIAKSIRRSADYPCR
jgi:hypothetical protein